MNCNIKKVHWDLGWTVGIWSLIKPLILAPHCQDHNHMTKQVHRAYIPVVIFFVMHFVLKKLSIIQYRFGFKNMFCVVKFYMFSFFPKNKVL